MIAIDLIKQQTLDADPRTIEQIKYWIEQEIQQCFLLLKRQKNCFRLFTRKCKSILNVL